MGKEKGTDNKNSKSLRVNGQGFVVFVVFGLLGPRWARKGGQTDNKNRKSLRLKGFVIFVFLWPSGGPGGQGEGHR